MTRTGGEATTSEPNEILENALAMLQLMADNGGLASLSAEEAQAILDELERRSGYERAYRASVRDYATLVSGVDLEFDEQADLIAELLEQLKQTVDALAHWFPRWGDPEGAHSQMMINARAQVA
ncbi:MAG: hypothetical protein H8D43_01325, partial [Chloroflexi bacterium]|nr:hypothetical protein [Chloroflexota bacterium]